MLLLASLFIFSPTGASNVQEGHHSASQVKPDRLVTPSLAVRHATKTGATKTGATKTGRVTNRKANPRGRVLVLMYHQFGEKINPMVRSPQKFRRDLEELYRRGFRPVNMTEYLDGNMELAPGAMPVILTFDDAWGSQFKIRPDGSIDPNSAVGIWESFAKTHPDFPVKGVFYVLPSMFEQPKLVKQKVEMLTRWGSELGNHTMHHKALRKLPNDEAVKAEIAQMVDFLEGLGLNQPFHFAAPYGQYPVNRELLKEFVYKGKVYSHQSAVLAGSSPNRSIIDPKFAPHYIQRVHGNGLPGGISDWLDALDQNRWKPFVAP